MPPFERLTFIALALTATTVHAVEPDSISAERPYVFREALEDKRFMRSALGRAFSDGTQDPHCGAIVQALFTCLAEAAPFLHSEDQNFTLDPALAKASGEQLNTPTFPGAKFLIHMVRRVMIDRRLPSAWLRQASKYGDALDLAKLRLLEENFRPIDSMYATIPALAHEYEQTVLRTTKAEQSTAELVFRDRFLDQWVAWGNFEVVDIAPPKASARRATLPSGSLIARLKWSPPRAQESNDFDVAGMPVFLEQRNKKRPLIVEAALKPQQLAPLSQLPKGSRVIVRGRIWAFRSQMSEIELRDALLFREREWAGVTLLQPDSIAACPMAVDDILGTPQPGGFSQ